MEHVLPKKTNKIKILLGEFSKQVGKFIGIDGTNSEIGWHPWYQNSKYKQHLKIFHTTIIESVFEFLVQLK